MTAHEPPSPSASPSAEDTVAKGALPREVVLLSWVSLFADISSEMVYPLLPLMVVGVLGATTTELGWIEGAAAVCVALLTAWAGWKSDARGARASRRVPWVRIGYALPVIGRACIALAPAWGWVLGGRLIDRVGKGIRGAPRDALIADATPADMRGRAFGFHRFMDTLGAFIGVVAAAILLFIFVGTPTLPTSGAVGMFEPGSLAESGTAIRWIIAFGAVIALASVVVTLRIREPGGPAPASTADAGVTTAAGSLRFSPEFRRVLLALTVFGVANSTDAFILVRLAEIGLSPWAVVAAYALFNLVYALGSSPAGRLSDRLGRKRILLSAWVLYAAVYAMLAMLDPDSAGSMVLAWCLMPLYGVYAAMTDGVGKALAADVAPVHRRGAAMGILAMAVGLATLVGSVGIGFLWHRFGADWAFGAAAVAALLATILGAALLPASPTSHA